MQFLKDGVQTVVKYHVILGFSGWGWTVVMCCRYGEPNQEGWRFFKQVKFCSLVCQVFFPGSHLIDLL